MEYYFTVEEPDERQDYNPVALVVDGKYKGEKVYLVKDHKGEHDKLSEGEIEFLSDFLERNYPRLPRSKFYKLMEALSGKVPDASIAPIFDEFRKFQSQKPSVHFKNSKLCVIPNIKEREIIYMASKSGSGKTTWISNYIKIWKKIYRGSPIWLISTKPLSEEPVFEGLGIIQLDISVANLQKIIGINKPLNSNGKPKRRTKAEMEAERNELEANDKPNMEHTDLADVEDSIAYRNFISEDTGRSLVIFDDIDGLMKSQSDMIYTIMKSIGELGRRKNIDMIVCRHNFADGHRTKSIINEAQRFVIFPSGLSKDSLKYMTNVKLDIPKATIDDIFRLQGRYSWACIQTIFPKYYVTENSVTMI